MAGTPSRLAMMYRWSLDVQVVVVGEAGVELRDDGLTLAGDGDDAQLGLGRRRRHRRREFGDRHVQDGAVVVQAEHHELELSAGEVHRVRGSRMLEHVDDFVAGDLFREEEHVQAHVLEHELVLRKEEGLVVDTGDDALGTELFRQQGADDVHRLGGGGVDRDEKVRLLAAGLLEDRDGRRVPEDGDDIGHGGEPLQPDFVVVDDGDVPAFVAEHLREMGSHLPGSFDDDLHTKFLK